MNSSRVFSRGSDPKQRKASARVLALGWGLLLGIVAEPMTSVAAATAPQGVQSMDARPMTLEAGAIGPDGAANVSLRMPQTAQAGALRVFLNGEDVTGRFVHSSCRDAQCLSARIGSADGLRAGKNVFQAEGKTQSGSKITARARVDGRGAEEIAAQRKSGKQSKLSRGAVANAESLSVAEPFLPPTVAFRTLNDGGYHFGQTPWISLAGSSYPASSPPGCSSGNERWTVMVFDRQTLAHKTSAPENSPQCFETNAAMQTYLQGLSDGDLVIAGTNFGFNADIVTALDTSAIGGTDYEVALANPAGYMVIGARGATPGSAFEPGYPRLGTTGWPPSARGILQEDANGDYNFLSGDGDLIRYAVVPNAPAFAFNKSASPITSIQVSLTADQKDANPLIDYISYTPAADAKDGFWLMRFNRGSLERMDDCANYDTSTAPVYYFEGCGRFYETNTSTWGASAGSAAMKQLAQDLAASQADPMQLLVLTTVGHATCCDWRSALGLTPNDDGGVDTGYVELYPVLQQLGGTPAYTTYGNGQTSRDTAFTPAYTLVTASGLGNALAGTVAESSTVLLPTHAQTGTISGTLERGVSGLFTPGQVSQEFTGALIARGGLDDLSVINRVAVQAPVEWPAQSASVLLSGADSIEGQIAAYRFISLSLLRDRYALGISGSHQDDLHYFFTGSLNTSIDYHIFDPVALPWPGSNAAGFTHCTSVVPGTNGNDTCNYDFATDDTLTFTVNDFDAVRAQTSLEVRYLTNVMQFFVSGSTNMRDSIVGGNANVGLALTGAAANVLGNQLMPMPATQTTTISWQSILGLLNGVFTMVAGVPGVMDTVSTLAADFAKAPETVQKIVKGTAAWSNEVAGVAGIASGAGAIKSTTSTTPLPNKYSKFAFTVGQLASGALKDQLSHGFDAMVDSITSDWGRIAAIGPRVVNVDDPAFFVPNQVVQELVLEGISSSAQRSFYGALMPSFFQVHYWPGVSSDPDSGVVNGVQQPDMGYATEHTEGQTCWAFYLDPHWNNEGQTLGAIPPWVSTYVPRPYGMPDYYGYANDSTDYYLIAKPSDSKGSDTETIPTIDPGMGALLFGPHGLNIPMMQFVHPEGPMGAVFLNAATGSDITTHPNSKICFSAAVVSLDAVRDPLIIHTATSLSGPASAQLYEPVQFTATVKAGETLVGEGIMYFRIDGKVAASVPMQSDGTATLEVDELHLGAHTIKASYGTGEGSLFDASSSAVKTLTIYGVGPDFRLSSSTNSLSVKRGSTSQAATISVASRNGAAGNVKFACSGLPMGATCNFAPSQLSITDGGTVTTTMTVSTVNGAALGLLGLLLLPLVGAGPARRRRMLLLSALMASAAVTTLTGCNDEKKSYDVPTGTVQVLVSATIGDVTRTMPMTVTISP